MKQSSSAKQYVHVNGWIRTTKLVLCPVLDFARFVGKSSPAQPPIPPDEDDVPSEMIPQAVETVEKV